MKTCRQCSKHQLIDYSELIWCPVLKRKLLPDSVIPDCPENKSEYEIIGCTDYKAIYMCSICLHKLDDPDCRKANEEKLYVKKN